MKEEKKRDNISVQNVHSKYAHIDAFDLAKHELCISLTSVSNQDIELTPFLPLLFSLTLYILAFAIFLTHSQF